MSDDDIAKKQESIAENAWQDYDFGGAKFEESSGWQESDENELTRTFYLESDDPDADSEIAYFKVKFNKDNRTDVEDAYALVGSSGNEIGFRSDQSKTPTNSESDGPR